MKEKTHIQKKMDLILDIKQHIQKYHGESLNDYFDGITDELIAKNDLDLIIFAVMKCDKYLPKKHLCILSRHVLNDEKFKQIVKNKSEKIEEEKQ